MVTKRCFKGVSTEEKKMFNGKEMKIFQECCYVPTVRKKLFYSKGVPKLRKKLLQRWKKGFSTMRKGLFSQ